MLNDDLEKRVNELLVVGANVPIGGWVICSCECQNLCMDLTRPHSPFLWGLKIILYMTVGEQLSPLCGGELSPN